MSFLRSLCVSDSRDWNISCHKTALLKNWSNCPFFSGVAWREVTLLLSTSGTRLVRGGQYVSICLFTPWRLELLHYCYYLGLSEQMVDIADGHTSLTMHLALHRTPCEPHSGPTLLPARVTCIINKALANSASVDSERRICAWPVPLALAQRRSGVGAMSIISRVSGWTMMESPRIAVSQPGRVDVRVKAI